MDPPYYDNVMYAELSDFFYVWLKRTAGHLFPDLFRRQLTDKENEAVANLAKFSGEKGARTLAGRDYQDRMASIFAECRRVLKSDGIMTLMFTHKATGAWGRSHHRSDGGGFRNHRVRSRSIQRSAVACTSGTRRRPTARSFSPVDLAQPRNRPTTPRAPRSAATGKTWNRWWRVLYGNG